MACFLVSAAEAAVTAVAAKEVEKKEAAREIQGQQEEGLSSAADRTQGIPFSVKLRWLRNMLLGGSVLLAFEHIWHGEITAWFPFLTAAQSQSETAVMLHEMATVGVAMALLITVVWLVMVAVADSVVKKSQDPAAVEE